MMNEKIAGKKISACGNLISSDHMLWAEYFLPSKCMYLGPNVMMVFGCGIHPEEDD